MVVSKECDPKILQHSTKKLKFSPIHFSLLNHFVCHNDKLV